jgi:hypothetical protein
VQTPVLQRRSRHPVTTPVIERRVHCVRIETPDRLLLLLFFFPPIFHLLFRRFFLASISTTIIILLLGSQPH